MDEYPPVVNNNPQPESVWYPVSNITVPYFGDVTVEKGLPQVYVDMLRDLVGLWSAKLMRNQLKMRYYNGKNVLKDFGISIPPSLLSVETVVGWPQKAVDAMAVRCRFDGFTASDAEVQAILDSVVMRSRLSVKYRQAVQSALIHSCCFATVMMLDGEPRIDLHSAETAAARWDSAKGRIAYGMTINAFKGSVPADMTLYTDDAVLSFRLTDAGFYSWEVQPINMGRPTIESICYRPTFLKPFGQSRITRAVMSITDSAVREALRTEISAEFFTSPQKYLLGADREAFKNTTKWEAYIGNIFAVARDENGDMPQFGQLSQGSMQPHTEYMRSLAARFSGETNVPISQLGVIHDQPASAEAIYAANEPLIIECEDFNDGARDTMRILALMAMAAEMDVPLSELDPRYADFAVNFRNPAMPSVVSMTDANMKIASVVPGYAGTDTFWEQIGFNEDTRKKVENEVQRQNAQLMVNALFGE